VIAAMNGRLAAAAAAAYAICDKGRGSSMRPVS